MAALDQSVIEIARDAIREQRPADVAGIVGDQPKTLLIGELVAALGALVVAGGISYLGLFVHRGSASVNFNVNSVDAFAADIVASGGKITKGPEFVDGDTQSWRQVDGEIAGVKISAIGEHRPLRKEQP